MVNEPEHDKTGQKQKKVIYCFWYRQKFPGDPGSKHGRNAHKNSAEGGEKSFHQSFAGKLPEKQKYRKLGKEKIKAKINFYAQNTAGKKLKQRDDACTGP